MNTQLGQRGNAMLKSLDDANCQPAATALSSSKVPMWSVALLCACSTAQVQVQAEQSKHRDKANSTGVDLVKHTWTQSHNSRRTTLQDALSRGSSLCSCLSLSHCTHLRFSASFPLMSSTTVSHNSPQRRKTLRFLHLCILFVGLYLCFTRLGYSQ